MAKIRYSDEFICPKCGRHTALVCHPDGTHQAHCMICDSYYDVEIANITNADRIRAMTDEELAEWIAGVADYGGGSCAPGCYDCSAHMEGCKQPWLDWLKTEIEHKEE